MNQIMIVDDHPIMGAGLAALIEQEDDLRVTQQVTDIEGALSGVGSARVDLAIVDLTLGKDDGLDLVRSLRSRTPPVPVLVLTMHDTWLYAERAFQAGAQGYVTKGEASEVVVDAIRTVLGGEIYARGELAQQLLRRGTGRRVRGDKTDRLRKLSNRELQVFRLIGKGRGTREIAESLGLSVKTVESHRANIKSKLGLKTASELVRQAVEFDLAGADLGQA